MNRSRKLKGAVGIALATCMSVTAIPAGSFFPLANLGSGVLSVYGAEQSEALTTTLNQTEVGTHEGTGSYTYDASAKTVTVTGSGTKFDKGAGSDDFFLASYAAKGDITISAKLSVSNPTGAAAFAGIIIRNSNDESGSTGAALYADMANGNKNQIRYGYHKESTGGGASQVNSEVTTDSQDIYIKLQVSGTTATYYVSSTADFSDETTKVKTQTIDGLDAKTVGFFATEGITATFSDVTISSTNTVDGVAQNKIIFDSETGEVVPAFSNSSVYSGNYDAGNSFTTVADGNVLSVNQTRSATVKGTIRDDKGFDYWLFPSTTEDMTISADVTIQSVDSGTDKQGLVIGQFDAKEGSAMKCDVIHFQKNKVFQHTFSTTSGTGACGDPKTATLDDCIGTTYSLSYTKSGNTAYMTVKSADGTVLIDNQSFDLTQDYEDLQAGQAVSYGLGFCGVVADISNVSLSDAAGNIVYDMNDYYVATGVAPVITNATSAISDDRNSINLNWDISTEGSGNIKYAVYVSKDGGEYTKAGESKVNSYTYSALDGDGSYSFKIVPFGGDTQGTELDTAAISYQTPLEQTTLTAEATSESVSLSWAAVDNATTYDVYRCEGTTGAYSLLTSTAEVSYIDQSVTAEEPYTYYVVAKSAENYSNPSETMQVLASDGHTGTYVYENEATTITTVSKSNDTVFDTSAELTLKADEDGTAQLFVNDTLVETKLATANQNFTFEITDLAQGRNDVEVIFTDNDGNKTRKTFNFVSNPEYDIIVDASYTGVDGAEVAGVPTYNTVEAAVNSVPADNTESKVIFIKNGEYNERVTVESPYVSLLGEDAEETHLYYSVCIANGNADSMWNRNAMYVDSTAEGFTAENLTVENSYNYTNGSDQQADALCIVADQTACVNIRLIGYQDTLLTDTRLKDESGNYAVTRQYFEKCYITGNVDFIYGAGTSVFEDCDIVARYTEYKSDGCYSAGRTYGTTDYGYVFSNCRFLAEEGVADGVYRMARPWGADDSTTFINCYLGRAISTDVSYGDMSGNTAANARFAEYGSYGPGYVVNNTRPYLSSSEAATFATATVLGDYDYTTTVDSLYQATPIDTAALTDAVSQAAAIILANVTENKYTSESMKGLAAAYKEVTEADVTKLSQEEVDALTAKLTAALSALVENSTSGGTSGETSGSTESGQGTVDITVDAGNSILESAKIDADATVTDQNGNKVDLSQVQIKVESSTEAATEVNDALTAAGITVEAGSNVLYYEINLEDSNGNALTLENGKAVVQFKIPEGINYEDYNFIIYHVNDDGVLEILTPSVSADGIQVEVSGFSPYAVVYELKDTTSSVADTTGTTTDTTSTTSDTTTTDTSSDATSDSTITNVQTGDHANALPYVILVFGSLAVIAGAGCFFSKKKKITK